MYYDLDAVLSDCVRVPVKFNVDAKGLGFLVDGGEDAMAKSEGNVPLWLAVPLASAPVNDESEVAFLNLEEPKALNEDAINVLRSEPQALDCAALCPMYTYLALKWCELFEPEDLINTLYNALKIRAKFIFDAALAETHPNGLDVYEENIYKQTAQMVKDVKRWIRAK